MSLSELKMPKCEYQTFALDLCMMYLKDVKNTTFRMETFLMIDKDKFTIKSNTLIYEFSYLLDGLPTV